MNYKKLKQLYMFSPAFLKTIYSWIPWSVRMGKSYRSQYDFLQQSKHWNKEQWHTYQTKELTKLLRYCNESIPYYRELFQQYNIDVESDDIWKEYYKIPLMSKEDLIENNDKLMPMENKSKLFSLTTGGTTGKPVTIYYDKTSYKQEWAFKMFFWKEAIGYDISSKKATFRGVSFSDKLYYDNPIYNEIRFSPFKLESDDTKEIVSKLKEYKPKYLHGYPSALEQLAKYLYANDEKLDDIEGVILISENIFKHQIDLLKTIFDCPVYSFYGLSERVIMASMDSSCDTFYAHPAYGITEIVDNDGINIQEKDVLGELVGTGFINYGMPLLRYKTADFSSWKEKPSSRWNMPALKTIKGRWNQEFLIGSDLSRVSLTALNMHSDIYNKIKKLQFFQDKAGVVQLNIVKEVDYLKDDEKSIEKEIKEKLGDKFTLVFNYLDSLPLTQAGKSKYLIQKLDIK